LEILDSLNLKSLNNVSSTVSSRGLLVGMKVQYDLDQCIGTPLFYAVEGKLEEIAELLSKYGALAE
jgi:hypothetical protein